MNRVVRTVVRVTIAIALVVGAAIVAGVASTGGGRTVQAVGELGAGGEYHAIDPVRVFDSRDPNLDVAPAGRKPTSTSDTGATFDVPIVGKGGLPPFVDTNLDGADDNVLAVAVTITVIDPDQLGYLRAFGAGAPEGGSSVVNYTPGEVVPNTAFLRPGDGGELTLRFVTPPAAGTVDVAIDVFGWVSSSTYGDAGARLIPVSPGRLYDSREDAFGGTPVGAREVVTIPIRGADSFNPTTTDIVPADDDVVGVMINLTGVNTYGLSKPTFVSALPVAPAAGANPSTSNLNLVPGQVRAVMSVVPVGPDGNIHLFNLQGDVDLVVDVVGYMIEGRDPATRDGRIVPLVAPFRAFDTRESDFYDQPLGPAGAEDWSFESFVNDVKIGGESVGAQSALIGNLTATNLTRQYNWAPVASFMTAYPSPSGDETGLPEASNLNVFEDQSVPNLVLLKYGSRDGDDHQIRFYNRAGFVDYLLDVTAVILTD